MPVTRGTNTTTATTAGFNPAAAGANPTPAPAPAQAPAAGGGGGGSGGQGGGGGGGGGAGGNQQNLPAQPGAQFALTPALRSNTPLDFSRESDIKLYYKSITALDIEYDLNTEMLKVFLESLKQRAVAANWVATLTVAKDGNNYNIIDNYGRLSLEDVTLHAHVYVGTQTRMAQNSLQIFLCLSNSLTEKAKARVFNEADKYTINGTPDGVLFLKIIIQLAHIDTKATITMIRTRLSSLDTKMAELQDDIVQFNEYVKAQRISLEARGEETLDLLVNLFKGYKAVADQAFVKYIEIKEDAYNEGENIDADRLMELAATKYRVMFEKGIWKQPTDAERKIVALTAQLERLQKQGQKKNDNKETNKQQDNNGQNKKKNKKNKNKADDNKTKWWLVPPKDSEPKECTRNGKIYYWCPNHGETGKWVRHKPAECKVNKDAKDKSTDKGRKLQTSQIRTIEDDDDF